jgi:hypothetical protein
MIIFVKNLNVNTLKRLPWVILNRSFIFIAPSIFSNVYFIILFMAIFVRKIGLYRFVNTTGCKDEWSSLEVINNTTENFPKLNYKAI